MNHRCNGCASARAYIGGRAGDCAGRSDASEERGNDVAGVRIVCAFIDDIYMISDLITKQDDIKVIEIKDYIKNPKSNGYRSYHMIVEIPVFFAKGKTPMRVELQIRTNGMDFWATLEHQLRYKKGIEEMPGYDEISEELLHSARAIIEADNEMQRIKDKIGTFPNCGFGKG